MAVKFYVANRNLMAKMGGKKEVMIVNKFMQNENADKAADYLKETADELTKLYNSGKMDEAQALMEEAEAKIREAQAAEKCMEEVNF